MQKYVVSLLHQITIKHTTMKNIEIITAREIELENLLKEAMDALLGAKGSFMAFEQTEIGKEDIKEVSKDQIEVLNSVFAKYNKIAK